MTETTKPHIADDETLCQWAQKDYQSRTGNTAAKASVVSADGREYRIELTDADGKTLDVYMIDPVTGTGTNTAKQAVNLPQTGSNSPTNRVIVFGALLLIAAGFWALWASGVFRRRRQN